MKLYWENPLPYEDENTTYSIINESNSIYNSNSFLSIDFAGSYQKTFILVSYSQDNSHSHQYTINLTVNSNSDANLLTCSFPDIPFYRNCYEYYHEYNWNCYNITFHYTKPPESTVSEILINDEINLSIALVDNNIHNDNKFELYFHDPNCMYTIDTGYQSNSVQIKVVSQAGNSETYTFHLWRKKHDESRLQSVNLLKGDQTNSLVFEASSVDIFDFNSTKPYNSIVLLGTQNIYTFTGYVNGISYHNSNDPVLNINKGDTIFFEKTMQNHPFVIKYGDNTEFNLSTTNSDAFTFNSIGTYVYECASHPYMGNSIYVTYKNSISLGYNGYDSYTFTGYVNGISYHNSNDPVLNINKGDTIFFEKTMQNHPFVIKYGDGDETVFQLYGISSNSFTFNSIGTYVYECDFPHPNMKNSIYVTYKNSISLGYNGYDSYTFTGYVNGISYHNSNDPVLNINKGDTIFFEKTMQNHPFVIKYGDGDETVFQLYGISSNSFTFNSIGTYVYECDFPHPNMKNSIYVTYKNSISLGYDNIGENTSYFLDGNFGQNSYTNSEDPELYATAGQLVHFKNSTGGHPFLIYHIDNGYPNCIFRLEDAYSDYLVFQSIGTYYYKCGREGHDNMGNSIYIRADNSIDIDYIEHNSVHFSVMNAHYGSHSLRRFDNTQQYSSNSTFTDIVVGKTQINIKSVAHNHIDKTIYSFEIIQHSNKNFELNSFLINSLIFYNSSQNSHNSLKRSNSNIQYYVGFTQSQFNITIEPQSNFDSRGTFSLFQDPIKLVSNCSDDFNSILHLSYGSNSFMTTEIAQDHNCTNSFVMNIFREHAIKELYISNLGESIWNTEFNSNTFTYNCSFNFFKYELVFNVTADNSNSLVYYFGHASQGTNSFSL